MTDVGHGASQVVHECRFVEEQEPTGRLILGPCFICGLSAMDAMEQLRATIEPPGEPAARDIAERRLLGLVEIVKRRRETGDPDDLADAAFILGAVDDFSNYVALLRGIIE